MFYFLTIYPQFHFNCCVGQLVSYVGGGYVVALQVGWFCLASVLFRSVCRHTMASVISGASVLSPPFIRLSISLFPLLSLSVCLSPSPVFPLRHPLSSLPFLLSSPQESLSFCLPLFLSLSPSTPLAQERYIEPSQGLHMHSQENRSRIIFPSTQWLMVKECCTVSPD